MQTKVSPVILHTKTRQINAHFLNLKFKLTFLNFLKFLIGLPFQMTTASLVIRLDLCWPGCRATKLFTSVTINLLGSSSTFIKSGSAVN